MALATLSIDLEARLAKLEGDLGKAARLNERTAKEIADRWESAGASVRAALGAAFAGLSAGAFVAMTRNIIDGLDALNDVADATGASIESISALEDIALRTGASLDTVEQALVKLNSVLLEAKPGSATEAELRALVQKAQPLPIDHNE